MAGSGSGWKRGRRRGSEGSEGGKKETNGRTGSRVSEEQRPEIADGRTTRLPSSNLQHPPDRSAQPCEATCTGPEPAPVQLALVRVIEQLLRLHRDRHFRERFLGGRDEDRSHSSDEGREDEVQVRVEQGRRRKVDVELSEPER